MEKKKISGFQLILITVTAVVAGGALLFGFLQKKSFDENAKTFKKKSGEMARIKSMAGYPSQDTVDEVTKSLEDYEGILTGLSKDYERVTLPEFTNVSPAKFSSKVSKATARLKKMYQDQGVNLPENWYLGFEKYTSVPAPKNATGVLLYNLEALVWLHEELLKCDPDALLNLHRPPVGIEKDGGETAANNKNLKNVERLPIELSFTAREAKARDFLNTVAKSKKYLFTIDTVKLKEAPASASSDEGKEEVKEDVSTKGDGFEGLFADGESSQDSAAPMSNEKLFTQVLGKENVAVFIDLNLTYLPAPVKLSQK